MGVPEGVFGLAEGAPDLGLALGALLGLAVGALVGLALGEALGLALGEALGLALGEALGLALGEALGLALGEALGLAVGEALGADGGTLVPPAAAKTMFGMLCRSGCGPDLPASLNELRVVGLDSVTLGPGCKAPSGRGMVSLSCGLVATTLAVTTTGLVAPPPWLNPPAAATLGAGFAIAGFAFAPLEAAATIFFLFFFGSGFLGIVRALSGVRTRWFRSYSSPAIAVMAVTVAWAVVDTCATREIIAT